MGSHTKKVQLPLIVRLIVLFLAVVICGAAIPARADTNISGPKSGTLTLANSPYIVTSDITVGAGTKLTIEPGVTLKFNGSASMVVNGELDAQGTADYPITFTSSNAVNPGVGSWGAIDISNNGVATMDHCLVRYGGYIPPYYVGLIRKSGAGALIISNTTIDTFRGDALNLTDATGAVNVSNSTIDGMSLYNSANGMVISGATSGGNITLSGNTIKNMYSGNNGMLLQNGAAPKINGNTFINSSGYGILINSGSSPVLDIHNTFTSSGTGLEMGFDAASSGIAHTYDNALTAPVVITGGTIVSPTNISWSSTRTYYVVGNITVNSGAGLSVQPGLVVKLLGGDASRGNLHVYGTFSAGSASGGKTYFTSYRDGTVGAAIRGATGAADPRDWGSFFAYSGATFIVDNCEFRHGGLTPPYDTGMIKKFGGGILTVTNSSFSNYNAYAFKLDGTTGSVSIAGNTIQASGYYSTYCLTVNNANSSTSINGNTITSSNPAYDCLIVTNSAPLIKGNSISGGLTGIKVTSSAASSPVISGNTITGAVTGISVSGATSTPQIIKNTITSNGVGVYATSSANPVIGGAAGSGNYLYNNSTWSVQNATSPSPPLINAQYNYWGGALGPYHATTNTGGNPNSKVTDNVDYTSFTQAGGTGSIAINGGATYVTQTDVILTLTCSDTSGCDQMQFSNDGTTFSSFMDYLDSTGWIIAGEQGSNTVYVRFKYGNGSLSPLYQATIIFDTVAPNKPQLTGPVTPTFDRRPVWSWINGGGGGNGTYRYQLTSVPVWNRVTGTTTDLSFSPATDVPPGTYTLAVQEQDDAGNWSLISSAEVTVMLSQNLTATVNGYGHVQGISTMGQSYSSPIGTHLTTFAVTDTITLTAVPATDFTFSTWGGDCPAGSGTCNVDLSGDRNISATFTTSKSALLMSPDMSAHDSLAAAYAAAPLDSSVTINGRDLVYGAGDLPMDRNVTVNLQGGYDDSFHTVTGKSVISGLLSISAGKLTVNGIAVRKSP